MPFNGPHQTWTYGEFHARAAAACIMQLADFKRPVEIRLIEDFPCSTQEKIAKAQLRQQIKEESPCAP